MRWRLAAPLWIVAFALLALRPAAAHAGEALRILLTNDDGLGAPGLEALQRSLLAAGHQVTVVAPLQSQSGSGGSLTIPQLAPPGRFVALRRHSGAGEPAVWSVDGTPGDAVRAALDVVLADAPPDLLVSGANFGQNLGRPAIRSSGTVGAALAGAARDVPALAVSVGIDPGERDVRPLAFAATRNAFAPTASFVARLIGRLAETREVGGRLLPPGSLLNLNVPVPWSGIRGFRITRLAEHADLEVVWQDVNGVLGHGGGPVLVALVPRPGPDPVSRSDTQAFRDGFVSLSLLERDTDAPGAARAALEARLGRLALVEAAPAPD